VTAADKNLSQETYDGPTPPVSVVVLTHDEEGNIADCLRSCAWSDDVHVVDSGSRDRTCAIAGALGAKVHHHPFTSFGAQRNWAIDQVPCRHPWHFHLDADERFTAPLVREVFERLGPDGRGTSAAAFRVPSRMIFMGQWIRHSSGYPAYQVRLFRAGACRFLDFGHGQRESASGPIETLTCPYVHYGFSKGLVDWLLKHNAYSDREANEGFAARRHPLHVLPNLWSHDRTVRRRAFKDLSYHLKARSWYRFIYDYYLRLGLFDGHVGFSYCAMIAMYEHWTELKMRERESDWDARTVALAQRMMEEDEPSA
jgi:glycosyltransferase involved in cell wall biosynthesis